MKATFTLSEWLLGLLGLLVAGILAITGSAVVVDLTLPSLCKWLGILLLSQSLIRDCCLLLAREMACECTALTEPSICLETVTGVLLLGQSALLWSIGVTMLVTMSLPIVVMTASVWWLLGMMLHDRVIILRTSQRGGDAPA